MLAPTAGNAPTTNARIVGVERNKNRKEADKMEEKMAKTPVGTFPFGQLAELHENCHECGTPLTAKNHAQSGLCIQCFDEMLDRTP